MILKNLLLCDAASVHPDNTFSVLRGGIDRFTVPDLSAAVVISMVATIELQISERERLHTADIAVLDMDGGKVVPPLRINFQPPAGNMPHRHNVIASVSVKFPRYGEYCIYVNVDGQELGTQSIAVVPVAQAAQG